MVLMTTPIALSIADAAKALGVSDKEMRRLINHQKVDARKHGTKWLVSYASLHDYFQSLEGAS